MFCEIVSKMDASEQILGRPDTSSDQIKSRKMRRSHNSTSTMNWIFSVGFFVLVFCINYVISVDSVEGESLTSSSLPESQEVLLSKDEEAAKRLLDKIEREVHAECQNHAIRNWMYATNITKENARAAVCQYHVI